jgi:hypothetical protein
MEGDAKKRGKKRKGGEAPPPAPPPPPAAEKPPLPPPPPAAPPPKDEAPDPYKLTPERPGKPTLLDKYRLQVMLDQLLVHPVWEDAFDVARIYRRTGWRWLERGRAERARLEALAAAGHVAEPLPEEEPFLVLVEQGEFYRAMHKSDLVTIIRQAAPENPDHAKWLLTHCYPDEFNAPIRLIIEREQKAFLDRLEANLPPDVFQHVLRIGLGAPRPPTGLRLIDGGLRADAEVVEVAAAGGLHPGPVPEVPAPEPPGPPAGGAGGDQEG